MLTLKALHISLVVAWFAGLFYLPRIFVNLAMVPPDSAAERGRLLLMAGKLYRFMTPLGVLLRLFRRLAACQDRAGRLAGDLPLALRAHPQGIPVRRQRAQPCLVSLL